MLSWSGCNLPLMILQKMHVEAIAVLVDGNVGWLNGSLDRGTSEVKRMTQGEASRRGGVGLRNVGV